MKIPLLKNTATNYLGLVFKTVSAILVTRWLVADLGAECYGLWALLWSFFGYSLLLDFGMGVAAQKTTATLLWQSDIQKYNRSIGTIFCFNCAMGLLVVAGTLIASCFTPQLLHLQQASPDKIRLYRHAFLLLGCGSALVFPLGIFAEILVGLQQMWIRNVVAMTRKLTELAGILLVFRLGGGLLELIVFYVANMALSDLVMLACIIRRIPGFRLRLHCDIPIFKEIFSFSGVVYVMSLARLLWMRGAMLMLSVFCGLVPVKVFQIGSAFPKLINQFTSPLQENISPLSALLYSKGKMAQLGSILIKSMRWNSFLCMGASAFGVIFARELLHCLLGIKDPGHSVQLCRIASLMSYITMVYRMIPEKHLLMSERHRLLAWVYGAECAIYVPTACILLRFHPQWGVFVVMLTAIASRIIGTFAVIVPTMMRDCHITPWTLFWNVTGRPFAGSLPAIVLAILVKQTLGHLPDTHQLIIAAATATPIYLLGAWLTNKK